MMGKKEHRSNISLAQEAEQQLAGNYYGFVGIPSATFVFLVFGRKYEQMFIFDAGCGEMPHVRAQCGKAILMISGKTLE